MGPSIDRVVFWVRFPFGAGFTKRPILVELVDSSSESDSYADAPVGM